MSDWLAIGPPGNWEIGVKKKRWAFSYRMRRSWSQINQGDRVFFYATAPVKGVIGYGTVAKTSQARMPFWPQEKEESEVLWPFQVSFSDVIALPRSDWETSRIPVEGKKIVFQRALQPIDAWHSESITDKLNQR